MFVSVSDIQRRLGREIAEGYEADKIEAWIETVEALILARIPDLQDRLDAGEISQTILTSIIADVVIRKINNPTGKQNERIDDYSYGLTVDAARGDLFLTDAEWQLLLPATFARGAFSVRPSFEADGYCRWWQR